MNGLRGAGRRGSVSVEVAILAPAFLLLIVLGIAHGRVAIAANAIDVAAHDAARAASISRTGAAAEANARAAAGEALQRQGLACVEAPRIDPDVSGFARGGLRLDFVSVTVTCEVSFLDLKFLPFIPESRVLTSTFVSPVDIFRERQ